MDYPLISPDPTAVHVELRGPVDQVVQVRAWISGRARGQVDTMVDDDAETPGRSRCRMTVVVGDPERQEAPPST